jgi:hypothetical protein
MAITTFASFRCIQPRGSKKLIHMPLEPIPNDAEPTRRELKQFMDLTMMPERLRDAWAAFQWRIKKREQHPDKFLVAYVMNKGWYEKEYLNGALWKSIREQVLNNASYKCACCPAKATEVHHRDYRPRVLSGDDISPLVALCRKCHRRIDEVKGKDSWNESERLLAELVTVEDARLENKAG